MLSIVRNVPFALAPCAGGVLAVAVRAHVARRYMQHVPKATAVGSSDYDADWVSLKRRLLNLQTPPMCDVDRKLRVVSSKIARINSASGHGKFVGQARTALCSEDLLSVVQALKDAKPGEVLIIDAQHSQRAVFGELFANEAKRKGLAAVIIDGGVRDVDSIRKLDIPVYARFVTPMAAGSYKMSRTQTIVSCGSIHVAPGEIVVGDSNGILVGSMEEFARIVPGAEKLQAIEDKVLAAVESGTPLLDLMNYDHHIECIKNDTPSLLAYNSNI